MTLPSLASGGLNGDRSSHQSLSQLGRPTVAINPGRNGGLRLILLTRAIDQPLEPLIQLLDLPLATN